MKTPWKVGDSCIVLEGPKAYASTVTKIGRKYLTVKVRSYQFDLEHDGFVGDSHCGYLPRLFTREAYTHHKLVNNVYDLFHSYQLLALNRLSEEELRSIWCTLKYPKAVADQHDTLIQQLTSDLEDLEKTLAFKESSGSKEERFDIAKLKGQIEAMKTDMEQIKSMTKEFRAQLLGDTVKLYSRVIPP